MTFSNGGAAFFAYFLSPPKESRFNNPKLISTPQSAQHPSTQIRCDALTIGTVAGNDALVPVERILAATRKIARAVIVAIDVNKSVAFGILPRARAYAVCRPSGNFFMCDYVLQVGTVAGNDALVPVERIFAATRKIARAVVVAIDVNKSVAFGILPRARAYSVCRPSGIFYCATPAA